MSGFFWIILGVIVTEALLSMGDVNVYHFAGVSVISIIAALGYVCAAIHKLIDKFDDHLEIVERSADQLNDMLELHQEVFTIRGAVR